MILPFMPVPLMAAVKAPKTYAEYQAHIAEKATDGAVSWTVRRGAGKYRTTPDANQNSLASMFGTSYMGHWWGSAGTGPDCLGRAVQHGLPSLSVLTAAQAASPRLEFYFELVSVGTVPPSPPITRNGYTSADLGGGSQPCVKMIDLIYWDGRPMIIQPYAGTGPAPYDW